MLVQRVEEAQFIERMTQESFRQKIGLMPISALRAIYIHLEFDVFQTVGIIEFDAARFLKNFHCFNSLTDFNQQYGSNYRGLAALNCDYTVIPYGGETGFIVEIPPVERTFKLGTALINLDATNLSSISKHDNGVKFSIEAVLQIKKIGTRIVTAEFDTEEKRDNFYSKTRNAFENNWVSDF